MGQGLGAKTELENDAIGAFFKLSEKGFIDVTGIDVPFGGSSLGTAGERGFHFGAAHRAVIDIGGQMSRFGEDLRVRNRVSVMKHSRMHVFQRADGALGRRPASRTNGRGAFRKASPAML